MINLKKEYINLRILDEINKKINTFNKTRENRIHMSIRLKGYGQSWKFIFFFLNFEAVIFVLLSLVAEKIPGLSSPLFTVSAGVFSIYVILLQYYINEQNYNERSLKVHYHQLEIEDLVLKLKTLIIKHNTGENNSNNEVLIEEYNIIMNQYQTTMKNNENHDPIDNDKREFIIHQKTNNVNESEVVKQVSSGESNNPKNTQKESVNKYKDYTIDNLIITLNNIVITLIPILVLLYVLTKLKWDGLLTCLIK